MTSINYEDEEFDDSMENYISGVLAAICGIETNPYDHVVDSDAAHEWDRGNIDTALILSWPTANAYS
jgi:hypothetical protein